MRGRGHPAARRGGHWAPTETWECPAPKLLWAAETPCMRKFSCCSHPPLIGSLYIASHKAHTGDVPGRGIAPKTVNGPEGGIGMFQKYTPALPAATLRLPGSQL